MSEKDVPRDGVLAWLLSSGTFVKPIAALARIYKIVSQIGPTVTLRDSGILSSLLVAALVPGNCAMFLSIRLGGCGAKTALCPLCFSVSQVTWALEQHQTTLQSQQWINMDGLSPLNIIT